MKYPNPNHQPLTAAEITPPSRPADAPSISHTATGKVMNSSGKALTGASASADAAPAMNAMAARRHPQESTTACEKRVNQAVNGLTAIPCRADPAAKEAPA